MTLPGSETTSSSPGARDPPSSSANVFASRRRMGDAVTEQYDVVKPSPTIDTSVETSFNSTNTSAMQEDGVANGSSLNGSGDTDHHLFPELHGLPADEDHRSQQGRSDGRSNRGRRERADNTGTDSTKNGSSRSRSRGRRRHRNARRTTRDKRSCSLASVSTVSSDSSLGSRSAQEFEQFMEDNEPSLMDMICYSNDGDTVDERAHPSGFQYLFSPHERALPLAGLTLECADAVQKEQVCVINTGPARDRACSDDESRPAVVSPASVTRRDLMMRGTVSDIPLVEPSSSYTESASQSAMMIRTGKADPPGNFLAESTISSPQDPDGICHQVTDPETHSGGFEEQDHTKEGYYLTVSQHQRTPSSLTSTNSQVMVDAAQDERLHKQQQYELQQLGPIVSGPYEETGTVTSEPSHDAPITLVLPKNASFQYGHACYVSNHNTGYNNTTDTDNNNESNVWNKPPERSCDASSLSSSVSSASSRSSADRATLATALRVSALETLFCFATNIQLYDAVEDENNTKNENDEYRREFGCHEHKEDDGDEAYDGENVPPLPSCVSLPARAALVPLRGAHTPLRAIDQDQNIINHGRQLGKSLMTCGDALHDQQKLSIESLQQADTIVTENTSKGSGVSRFIAGPDGQRVSPLPLLSDESKQRPLLETTSSDVDLDALTIATRERCNAQLQEILAESAFGDSICGSTGFGSISLFNTKTSALTSSVEESEPSHKSDAAMCQNDPSDEDNTEDDGQDKDEGDAINLDAELEKYLQSITAKSPFLHGSKSPTQQGKPTDDGATTTATNADSSILDDEDEYTAIISSTISSLTSGTHSSGAFPSISSTGNRSQKSDPVSLTADLEEYLANKHANSISLPSIREEAENYGVFSPEPSPRASQTRPPWSRVPSRTVSSHDTNNVSAYKFDAMGDETAFTIVLLETEDSDEVVTKLPTTKHEINKNPTMSAKSVDDTKTTAPTNYLKRHAELGQIKFMPYQEAAVADSLKDVRSIAIREATEPNTTRHHPNPPDDRSKSPAINRTKIISSAPPKGTTPLTLTVNNSPDRSFAEKFSGGKMDFQGMSSSPNLKNPVESPELQSFIMRQGQTLPTASTSTSRSEMEMEDEVPTLVERSVMTGTREGLVSLKDAVDAAHRQKENEMQKRKENRASISMTWSRSERMRAIRSKPTSPPAETKTIDADLDKEEFKVSKANQKTKTDEKVGRRADRLNSLRGGRMGRGSSPSSSDSQQTTSSSADRSSSTATGLAATTSSPSSSTKSTAVAKTSPSNTSRMANRASSSSSSTPSGKTTTKVANKSSSQSTARKTSPYRAVGAKTSDDSGAATVPPPSARRSDRMRKCHRTARHAKGRVTICNSA